MNTCIFVALLAVAAGAAVEPGAAPARGAFPSAGPYVDAQDYPTPAAGRPRFRAIEARLVRGFDQVCGDTFCEGEYSNLQALRFRCSVAKVSGRVHACAWTFTGSTAQVEPVTGGIEVAAPTWTCHSPVASGTPLSELLRLLEQRDPLHVLLPGTGESLYDSLVECL